MKDSEIKSLFANLNIPQPSAGFEDRIISAATAHKPMFVRKYAAIAALFLFVASFAFMNFSTDEYAQQYASLVDDTAFIDEDEIYEDIIIASN